MSVADALDGNFRASCSWNGQSFYRFSGVSQSLKTTEGLNTSAHHSKGFVDTFQGHSPPTKTRLRRLIKALHPGMMESE